MKTVRASRGGCTIPQIGCRRTKTLEAIAGPIGRAWSHHEIQFFNMRKCWSTCSSARPHARINISHCTRSDGHAARRARAASRKRIAAGQRAKPSEAAMYMATGVGGDRFFLLTRAARTYSSAAWHARSRATNAACPTRTIITRRGRCPARPCAKQRHRMLLITMLRVACMCTFAGVSGAARRHCTNCAAAAGCQQHTRHHYRRRRQPVFSQHFRWEEATARCGGAPLLPLRFPLHAGPHD